MNNHGQDIFNDPIVIEPPLTLNSQSTTITNADAPPITTNNFSNTIKLPKLELLNQPTRFRHNREPKTLGNGCPAVQIEGAPQRSPLLFIVNSRFSKNMSFLI